jgi:hypothetical protein
MNMGKTVLTYVRNRSKSNNILGWISLFYISLFAIRLSYSLLTDKHPADLIPRLIAENKYTLSFLVFIIAMVLWARFKLGGAPKPTELHIEDSGITLYARPAGAMLPQKVQWQVQKDSILDIEIKIGVNMIVIKANDAGAQKNRIITVANWVLPKRVNIDTPQSNQMQNKSQISIFRLYNAKTSTRNEILASDVGRALAEHGLLAKLN